MLKRFSSIKLCNGLLFSILSLSAHSANLFEYKSEAGDWVGKGFSNSYDDSNTRFSIEDYGNYCSIWLDISSGENWGIKIHPPLGQKFEPKVYKNVGSSPNNNYPMLSVSSYSSGCNNTSGEFKVLEIAYDRNNKIVKFAVDFVQHCERLKPALYGMYRYNSSIPTDLNDYIASFPAA